MVLGTAIRIGQTVFKYRKYIYRTLVAQDRAIDKAFKIGGYGRQTRYGARHGSVIGTVIGSLINTNAPDSPGNEFQKPFQRQRPTASTPYKTRSRFSTRTRTKRTSGCPPGCGQRRSRSGKYY